MVEYTVARTNCPSNSDRKTNRHRDMVTNKQVDTQANRRTDIKETQNTDKQTQMIVLKTTTFKAKNMIPKMWQRCRYTFCF